MTVPSLSNMITPNENKAKFFKENQSVFSNDLK